MPGYKRKYTKRAGGTRRYKRKDHYAASKIQAVVRRALNKNIETKTGIRPATDGAQITHNSFQYISNSLLQTSQGTGDEESTVGQRIGDKIYLKGIAIRGMLELNERYTDVTFRVIVVKSAKGDIPTITSLWQGASGNKMLDSMDTERYTVLFSKYYKVKATNTGVNSGASVGTGAGVDYTHDFVGDNYQTQSRATRLFKIWIPGHKFGNKGYITYENNSTQPKFFDYHCMVYAYSNYTTLEGIWDVGRINDAYTKLYYKDA